MCFKYTTLHRLKIKILATKTMHICLFCPVESKQHLSAHFLIICYFTFDDHFINFIHSYSHLPLLFINTATFWGRIKTISHHRACSYRMALSLVWYCMPISHVNCDRKGKGLKDSPTAFTKSLPFGLFNQHRFTSQLKNVRQCRA